MAEKKARKSRKHIELNVKIKALDEIKRGIPISAIAKDLEVCENAVKLWINNEAKIKQWQDELQNVHPKSRKILTKPFNTLVDEALWIWFQERRSAGCPLSGPLLQMQALRFHKELGGTQNFSASQGWLTKWLTRHSIRCVTMSGEKLSANNEEAEKYRQTFLDIIRDENLSPEQIFNADETGVNFRQMPWKTLSAKNGSHAGFKVQKERLTVMAISNALGTLKLELVVIGKSQRPRALKNIAKLPVSYKSQRSAWMTGHLFEDWFNNEFVPQVTIFLRSKGLPPKAILFLENCGAHPQGLGVNAISVRFFPPNTTSIIQPMDQGVLQNFKMCYRQHLIAYILDKLKEGITLKEALKSISREVIWWAADAWHAVPPTTIIKSWIPLWPGIVDHPIVAQFLPSLEARSTNQRDERNKEVTQCFVAAIQNEEENQDIKIVDVEKWLNNPHLMTEEDCLEENDVINIVRERLGDQKANPSEPSQSLPDAKRRKVTHSEIKEYLDIIGEYFQEHSHYTKENLLALESLKYAVRTELLMSTPLTSKAA